MLVTEGRILAFCNSISLKIKKHKITQANIPEMADFSLSFNLKKRIVITIGCILKKTIEIKIRKISPPELFHVKNKKIKKK